MTVCEQNSTNNVIFSMVKEDTFGCWNFYELWSSVCHVVGQSLHWASDQGRHSAMLMHRYCSHWGSICYYLLPMFSFTV